jgi:cysteine desulfuration protein SufE
MDTVETTIDRLVADFDFLEDWEDRYRYVIELGKTLDELTDAERTAATKVRGCASQVWLVSRIAENGEPVLTFRGDSDALIVRGLIAILFALFSGRTAREIIETDPEPIFARIGLREHLTSQRSNGLTAMFARIRSDAKSALGAAVS